MSVVKRVVSCLRVILYGILLFLAVCFIPVFISWMVQVVNIDHEGSIVAEGGKYVTLKNGKIMEYFESGESNNPLVVYFPGFGTTAKIIEGFSLPDYYLVGISIPGFGGSSRDPNRTLEEFPGTIVEVLTSLGLESREIIIVGASFGALHAASFACGLSHSLNIQQIHFICPAASAAAVETGLRLSDFTEGYFIPLLFHLVSKFVYTYPRLMFKLMGLNDCMKVPEDKEKNENQLFDDIQRCGRYSQAGYVDNTMLNFTPLNFFCFDDPDGKLPKHLIKKLFFSFGKEDKLCDEKHHKWYIDRFQPTQNQILWHPEGHCHCSRDFEKIFHDGVSRMKILKS